MHPTVAAKQSEVAELCRELAVRRLDVFGSATHGQFDARASDVDVLVEFSGGLDIDRFFAIR